jgi:hypothetical protein
MFEVGATRNDIHRFEFFLFPVRLFFLVLNLPTRLCFLTLEAGCLSQYGYQGTNRSNEVRIPAGPGIFSLLYRVQIGSGVHPASYPMDTAG